MGIDNLHWGRIHHVKTEVVGNRHAKEAMPAGENKRVARERGGKPGKTPKDQCFQTEATEACSLLQRGQVN